MVEAGGFGVSFNCADVSETIRFDPQMAISNRRHYEPSGMPLAQNWAKRAVLSLGDGRRHCTIYSAKHQGLLRMNRIE